MTTLEMQSIQKAVLRHKSLRVEINALESEWDTLDDARKRQHDKKYGEALGIEYVLELLHIPYTPVDE